MAPNPQVAYKQLPISTLVLLLVSLFSSVVDTIDLQQIGYGKGTGAVTAAAATKMASPNPEVTRTLLEIRLGTEVPSTVTSTTPGDTSRRVNSSDIVDATDIMDKSSSGLMGNGKSGGKSGKVFTVEWEPVPAKQMQSSISSGGGEPYFEVNRTTLEVTVKAGAAVVLDCTVVLLKGKTVTWLRKQGENLELLTVGNVTYYNDPRLRLNFRYPNNWRLEINSTVKGDQGQYECQVSTYPVKTLVYILKVLAPDVVIVDENGHSVLERHYKADSSMHLTCRVTNLETFTDKIVWLKDNRTLSRTENRIKIRTAKNEYFEKDLVQIHLSVLQLEFSNSGNYSCRAGAFAEYTVVVHVVTGDLPAAVHRSESRAWKLSFMKMHVAFSLFLVVIFYQDFRFGFVNIFLDVVLFH